MLRQTLDLDQARDAGWLSAHSCLLVPEARRVRKQNRRNVHDPALSVF
jgi:hypothetical protein